MKPPIDITRLTALYGAGMGTVALGERFGLCGTTVRRVLKSAGVTLRGKGARAGARHTGHFGGLAVIERKGLIALVNAGRSLEWAGKVYGVSKQRASQIVRNWQRRRIDLHVDEVRARIECGESQDGVATRYGVSRATVRRVCGDPTVNRGQRTYRRKK